MRKIANVTIISGPFKPFVYKALIANIMCLLISFIILDMKLVLPLDFCFVELPFGNSCVGL
jgi:hypothetical protein